MNEELNTSIEFLFAKPYIEHCYIYGVNSIEDLSMIEKDELRKMVIGLGCKNYEKLEFLLSRNFPFLYNNSEKQIYEFEEIEDDLTKEDLHKMMIDEMQECKFEEKSIYDNTFGCNFFRKNIYGELNLWRS